MSVFIQYACLTAFQKHHLQQTLDSTVKGLGSVHVSVTTAGWSRVCRDFKLQQCLLPFYCVTVTVDRGQQKCVDLSHSLLFLIVVAVSVADKSVKPTNQKRCPHTSGVLGISLLKPVFCSVLEVSEGAERGRSDFTQETHSFFIESFKPVNRCFLIHSFRIRSSPAQLQGKLLPANKESSYTLFPELPECVFNSIYTAVIEFITLQKSHVKQEDASSRSSEDQK